MLGNYGAEDPERSREVRRLVSKQQEIQGLKNEFDAKIQVATQALLGKVNRLPNRRPNLYQNSSAGAPIARASHATYGPPASFMKNYEVKESLKVA